MSDKSSKVLVSSLKNQRLCGAIPVSGDDKCGEILEKLMTKQRQNKTTETLLVRLIKCLAENTDIDNDLVTVQSSIILELTSLPPNGLEYLDRYCTFFYDKIYAPLVRELIKKVNGGSISGNKNSKSSNQPKTVMDRYIKNYTDAVESSDLKPALLKMKRESIYEKDAKISDEQFIDGIKRLSVVFMVLEYADQISTYGDKNQSSMVDKMNQILAEKPDDGTFVRVKNKRLKPGQSQKQAERRRLPKLYQGEIEYLLGCNCMCNSTFILAMLRILAKNGRLGDYSDPRPFEAVNALKTDNDNQSGHTFITVNLDPLNPTFKSLERFYIECTAEWSTYNPANDNIISDHPVPIYQLDGKLLEVAIMRMVDVFLKSSHSILKSYGDRLYPIEQSKLYINVIDDYLNRNAEPDQIEIWQQKWPKLFDEDHFAPYFQVFNENLSVTKRVILILEYLKRFPKVKYLRQNYRPLLQELIHTRFGQQLAKEIRLDKVKYRGQLLTEFLAGWDIPEDPGFSKMIRGMIQASRKQWGW